ncbi:MAG: MOSC domain-containing protein [Rhodospirillaceae bacterium]|nr:MOSC domain-containing protein [Rhodospirillaceae bacterium]
MASVHSLYRFPIKGFSGERLKQVALTPSRTFPGDRRFAVRHTASAFDQAKPTWQKKREFLQLAHSAELAKIYTTLDPETGIMRIESSGVMHFAGNVSTPAGRKDADAVLNTLIKDPRGPVALVDAGAISLTDVEPPYISIINLASLREIAGQAGREVEAIRFRGNIVIESEVPWAEFDWVGRTLTIGAVKFKVAKRIQRCVATSVNPGTAERDIEIPALLQKAYDHMDCGIYAEAVTGGVLREGDALAVA